MFSPDGTVKTAELISMNTGYTGFNSTSAYLNVPGGIVNMNLSSRDYRSYISNIVGWLNQNVEELYGEPANFMILLGDYYPEDNRRNQLLQAILGVDCYYRPSANSTPRVPPAEPPAEGTAARKVWDYILGDKGPFGTVNPGNISILTGSDIYIGALNSNMPSTMVPLLLHPTGSAEIAIDPEHRLLFIGNVEDFGTENNRNVGTEVTEDERRFMKNIIAFVINAAQYGEYFLSEFK
jgi:hypothetical protein